MDRTVTSANMPLFEIDRAFNHRGSRSSKAARLHNIYILFKSHIPVGQDLPRVFLVASVISVSLAWFNTEAAAPSASPAQIAVSIAYGKQQEAASCSSERADGGGRFCILIDSRPSQERGDPNKSVCDSTHGPQLQQCSSCF